jgi:hypothetical protein
MALTNAQRQLALAAILGCSDVVAASGIPGGTNLAQLLPGVTPAQVLTALVTAIGTNFDTQLTTVTGSVTAILDVQLAAAQAQVAAIQAQIAAI